jgi:transcription elongation factor/antiterminator RfaH
MAQDAFPWHWYVLHTRSRFEYVVQEGLAKKAFEVFLPRVQMRSRRKDRRQMIQVPLFPGYVFVHSDLNPQRALDIVKTTGVVRFVGNREGPLPVPAEAIASLRIMVESEQQILTGRRLRQGDPVVVVGGPLAGVMGTFVRYRGQNRVVVHILALGQYAAVEVDAADVEPLSRLHHADPRQNRSGP